MTYTAYAVTETMDERADTHSKPAPVHVDAAAQAALLAIDRGAPGIFNIAEDDGFVSIAKARGELGWNLDFRL
jgi:nucleoside-diphosphate-sugar epimerase